MGRITEDSRMMRELYSAIDKRGFEDRKFVGLVMDITDFSAPDGDDWSEGYNDAINTICLHLYEGLVTNEA